MPRNAAAPLGADIVTVGKGEARPLGEAKPRVVAEPRIGLTIRLPEAIHEQLRLVAFQRRTSKQALIERWVADQLTKVT